MNIRKLTIYVDRPAQRVFNIVDILLMTNGTRTSEEHVLGCTVIDSFGIFEDHDQDASHTGRREYPEQEIHSEQDRRRDNDVVYHWEAREILINATQEMKEKGRYV